jgi:hypothetical protein
MDEKIKEIRKLYTKIKKAEARQPSYEKALFMQQAKTKIEAIRSEIKPKIVVS